MNQSKLFRLGVCAAVVSLVFALVACAPQSSTSSSDEDDKGTDSAVTIQWSPDADCTVCHSQEGSSLSTIPCIAEERDNLACTMCHTDASSLATVHEGTTTADRMPKRLKETVVSAEACEACHETYEQLASKTADSSILTDSKGTTVNPHAVPSHADHADITCGSCHTMHSGEDMTVTAPKACGSCHHAGVYECGTCHERH